MTYHPHIQETKGQLQKLGETKLLMLLKKLTEPKDSQYLPQYHAMWKAVEKRSILDDNLWVHAFLSAVERCYALPPYYYISGQEQRELTDKIGKHVKSLTKLLQRNGLDAHLVCLNRINFNGFFTFEDFGESNQQGIENDGIKKLSYTQALEGIAQRSKTKIKEATTSGKKGKKVQAIRFIRLLAKRNIWLYEQPLNAVLATAAMALYGIEYSESDIRNLLNR